MAIARDDRQTGGLLVTELRIDNPPLNVIDLAHCRLLHAHLQTLRAEDRSRLLVLRGTGRCFSTGVDISEHTPTVMPELLPAFHALFYALLDLRAVTVAALHGYCLGGAAELALACDRVVAEDATRLGFPEIRVGCYPPVAIPLLSARVGRARAVEMILSGAEMPVATLAHWGLVDRVVAKGELDTGIAAELEIYANKSAAILGAAVELLHDEARANWAARIAPIEQRYLAEVLPHPDASEGIAAFQGKRAPRWLNT